MLKTYKNSTFAGKIFWFFAGSIIYTYFGYPLIITLLSKFRSKPKPFPIYTPSATLLIAAYNEDAVIEDKILNCLELDYPKELLQILVITDGSNDRTPHIVEQYANKGIELMHQPERRGKMAAINRAIRNTRGEIIIFSDANNFYPADTLKELILPFSDPLIGAVSGAKVILQGDGSLGESEGLYWKYESFIKEQESRFGNCTAVAGEVLAIRRKAYTVPPDHIINDDFYIAMQIIREGYRVIYNPKAMSFERVSASAPSEITRRRRIIAGRYQAIFMASKLLPLHHPIISWQIISHKFLRPLVPFSMIGAALTNLFVLLRPPRVNKSINKLVFLASPFNLIMLALQLAFYALAWIGKYLEVRGQPSKLARLLYLPTFLVNSNLAALQGLFHFLKEKQLHLWERVPRR